MFAISESNYESTLAKCFSAFLGKEVSDCNVESVWSESGVCDKHMEVMKKAMEYMKKEWETPLLQHKSHIQMLLTMGVRDCPEQVEVYSKVFEVAKSYLDEWESLVAEGFFCETFGVVDIVLYCCTFNLFRYVMVPTWRDLYPKISFLTGWRCRCSNEQCIRSAFPNVSLAATVREGGQIDVRPDPAYVSHLADLAIDKNKNFKKEESQRQKEKQMKAEAKKEEERKALTGPVEEPTNEYEKKVFEVLNAMGIPHTTVQHEAAKTVEDVVKFCDRSLGLPTKNLFLKAKKPHDANDSGFWMVIAAFDTTVDMKKLTSDLGYKSGSLRFADNSLLKSILGVEEGHLSLFAKMNDVEKKVQVIIDKRLMDADKVLLHPLINTSSTILDSKDFKIFAEKYAPGYQVMEF